MKERLPFVSIITVNYNGKELLKECFDSLQNLHYPKDKLEIIMVDNCSRDGSIPYVKKHYPKIKIFENNINNYCKANNVGIRKAKGKYIAILNNDTKVDTNWLIALVKVMDSNARIGAAGSKILFTDGRIQSVGHTQFPYHYRGDKGWLEDDVRQYNKIRKVESTSNCSALYCKKALQETGGFDEDFGMYMEDVDMSFRLRKKGWDILFVPQSVVYHKLYGSKQDEKERQFYIEKNRLLFIAKYFPEKLPETMYGFGEIIKLSSVDFQRILIAIFHTLVKQHGFKKAGYILERLQKSLRIIDEYREHCFRVELENKSYDLKQKILTKEAELRNQNAQLEELNVLLQNKGIQLRDQERYINEQVEVIEDRDKQRKALEDRIKEIDAVLRQRDLEHKELATQLRDQDTVLQERDKRIQLLEAMLKEKEDQLRESDVLLRQRDLENRELATQLRDQDAILQEREKRGQLLEAMLNEKENQLRGLGILFEKKDSQLREADFALGEKRDELKESQAVLKENNVHLQEMISKLSNKDSQINNLENTLKLTNDQILKKDSLLAQQENELLTIYNSETYRFIVRPIIWPLFSFLKSIGNLLKLLAKVSISIFAIKKKKQKKKNVCMAQFYSTSPQAQTLGNNEYFIKLVNNEFSEQAVNLMIDIWPYRDGKHPERHYSYFSVETVVKPKSSKIVQFIYNWDSELKIFGSNSEKKCFDFWRGELASKELYRICAFIYDKDNNCLDSLAIVQRLIK